jgi:2-C-methyl-D-erythritol 4-phosphate cytidylyltransferase
MSPLWIVVAAAGGGSRFGAAPPKQYVDLGGAPMLARTLKRLRVLDPTGIVVALAPGDTIFEGAVAQQAGVEALRCGGNTRAATVRNALGALRDRCGDGDWVLVHDAARPCVPQDALRRLVAGLADDPVGGLLGLPVADTLKHAGPATPQGGSPRVLRSVDRDALWLAQTPQMFRYRILVRALAASRECAPMTDEAQAVEALAATGACAMPRLVRGSPANIKVTYPEDLALAAAILAMQDDA